MPSRIKRKEHITKTRRKQILKAALSEFSARGYGESTMADIAEAAGIGVGTIYIYYKDKRSLLIALIQQMLLSPGLLQIFDRMSEQPGRDVMESLIEERLEFGFTNAQKILFLFFEIQRDPKLRRQYVQEVVGPLLGRLEDYIRAQVKRGTFRKVDEHVMARTMVGVIIGNMILYRLEQRDSPLKKARTKDIAHELSGLFINGLARK
jgi:AcrR family transcriptional regulator